MQEFNELNQELNNIRDELDMKKKSSKYEIDNLKSKLKVEINKNKDIQNKNDEYTITVENLKSQINGLTLKLNGINIV